MYSTAVLMKTDYSIWVEKVMRAEGKGRTGE
jgi:hypothetical protein